LETTFREKLHWLEEAETLSLRLRARRQAAKKKSLPLREKAEIPKAGLHFQLFSISVFSFCLFDL